MGRTTDPQSGRLVVPLGNARAEVAIELADHFHGRGLGAILIERLAVVAEVQGIGAFVTEVLPENAAMLNVFRDGFDARLALREGVEFPTAAWRLARDRFSPQLAVASDHRRPAYGAPPRPLTLRR